MELDEDPSITADLDENGLPIVDESSPNSSSFASDFYNSGTDWSRLSHKRRESSGGTLVQRYLFQMWGFKKPAAASGEDSRPRVSSTQRDLFQVWGIEKPEASAPPPRKRALNRESESDRPRACPFYKKMPGTPFTVDAFRYIYPLELDKEHVIEGIKVTMFEANDCPGAALIHFCLKDGKSYLHTGDFRASELMKSYNLHLSQHINVLYLDTTYCYPKYRCCEFRCEDNSRLSCKAAQKLIVVGAYSIGKEQVYVAISQALGLPIYTNASRRRILQSFGWPELTGKLCSHGDSSSLHVMPLSFLRHENLKEYMKSYKQQYTTVLAFRPTGWTYSESIGNELGLTKPNRKGNITIYGVPYSEHSSFTELQSFVKFLRPDKIIPTVNVGNTATRDKMQSYFREWLKA